MNTHQTDMYKLSETGEFVINNYNSSKAFSSFFPGVAGKNGIPMWTFYVNRGQCICSMGIEGKHNPIMEFLPANWAYNLAPTQGFRTFIKLADSKFYEPFQNHYQTRDMDKTQQMRITSSKLIIEEINKTLGLKFTVEYYNIPQEKYAGLIRNLTIENIGDKPIALEGLDGLPLIIPFGINNFGLKNLRRLFEAFVEVVNHENNAPFFKSKVLPTDTPDVVKVKKGNFYLGFIVEDDKANMVTPLVDPDKIFGIRSDYNFPERFVDTPYSELINNQILENRLPAAMGGFSTTIKPNSTFRYSSIIGHADSVDELNKLIPTITKTSYIKQKDLENSDIIKQLTQNNFICSNNEILDSYVRQNFLDNALRGGFPHTLTGKDSKTTVHFYSRKHGDLERDYNDFRLKPTPYSQGNGNFRDVNQNRRNDLFFNPDVKESNVVQFYNLIQLDGFNPLVIKEIKFVSIDHNKTLSIFKEYLDCPSYDDLMTFTKEPFTPGELMSFLKENKIEIKTNADSFMGDLLCSCEKQYGTEHGEGYWTDHWTYNIDLLENYLAVYPENKRDILFENKSFTFYDNSHIVKPRNQKYVIWNDTPMQLDSVEISAEKEELINQRTSNPNLVRTDYGKGSIYHTNLANKMLNLIINKLASLDSAGIGVEMETDKPNWYDALNGLPGIIGSSLNETLELKRLIQYLITAIEDKLSPEEPWYIFEEMEDFIACIRSLMLEELTPFDFWNSATSIKESYRHRTILGISGKEIELTSRDVKEFLELALSKVNAGIDKAWDKDKGVISSYFVNEVKEYKLLKNQDGSPITSAKGFPCYQVKEFEHRSLPLFLEGPVHFLRSCKKREVSHELIKNIRKSGLYDQKLKMYKVNECLDSEPEEIGRARTFSPGWFENESIWLHMEYKYMLELIRNEFYQEFYHDFKNVFIPFLNPEMYGRSILENSSFIVSSANPDPALHGNGFVARLSGATAEFINILMFMVQGKEPFKLNKQKELTLAFTPAIPKWLFTDEEKKYKLFLEDKWQEVTFPKDSFSFIFLGEILVTYINKQGKDTFGQDRVKPVSYSVIDLDGKETIFNSHNLTGDIVHKIRDRQIKQITIELN